MENYGTLQRFNFSSLSISLIYFNLVLKKSFQRSIKSSSKILFEWFLNAWRCDSWWSILHIISIPFELGNSHYGCFNLLLTQHESSKIARSYLIRLEIKRSAIDRWCETRWSFTFYRHQILVASIQVCLLEWSQACIDCSVWLLWNLATHSVFCCWS